MTALEAGAGEAGLQQRTDLQVAAAAAQVDSHLPDHVHPVLLATAPLAEQAPRRTPPLHLVLEVSGLWCNPHGAFHMVMPRLLPLPLLLLCCLLLGAALLSCCGAKCLRGRLQPIPERRVLQVASRVAGARGGAELLAGAWVRRASLALPHLTLAADDALLTFGDALQRTLQAAAASPAKGASCPSEHLR